MPLGIVPKIGGGVSLAPLPKHFHGKGTHAMSRFFSWEKLFRLESLIGFNFISRRRRSVRRPFFPARRRLRLESLEDRRVLAVYTPTIFTDSNVFGAGSLRDAIITAN